MKLGTVLVAIRDTTSISSILLEKAGALARPAGATVELFHAMNEPVALDAVLSSQPRGTFEEKARQVAERSKQRLERAAKSVHLRGLDVRCHVEWDYPPHEAIVRRALAARADLVIGETRPHRMGARLLLANTDWELIRHCPVPLLLVKSRSRYERPAIIAAVDPFHANAKPADLDARVLDAAQTVAGSLRGQVHLFHAYMPVAAVVPVATAPPVPMELSPEMLRIEERRVRDAIDKLGARTGVPTGRRHVMLGDVASQMEELVRRTNARIVVMGAISRSGLKRLFIGNTAERVLDRLRCDVLVVKPKGFAASVPKRRTVLSSLARRRRGR